MVTHLGCGTATRVLSLFGLITFRVSRLTLALGEEIIIPPPLTVCAGESLKYPPAHPTQTHMRGAGAQHEQRRTADMWAHIQQPNTTTRSGRAGHQQLRRTRGATAAMVPCAE